jgi:hypothetical protein
MYDIKLNEFSILGDFAKGLRKGLLALSCLSRMSVRTDDSARTGRISVKFCAFLKLSTGHSKVRLQSNENASFLLLVGETPKAITCFGPKLLPAATVMHQWP